MKMIQAIIRHEKLGDVKSALTEIGVVGLNVTEIQGRGVQKGQTRQWRGAVYDVDLLPKIKLEVVVDVEIADLTVDTIQKSAFTGDIGDGKIFVWNVEEVVRVRTNERGKIAI
ncbi:MAG TPA: P-II family nitrogen regulator [Methanomassiliicoccales archaeon]|nr:P-II family nitrogen regulator [Methanomassiliicoccales archaeon]